MAGQTTAKSKPNPIAIAVHGGAGVIDRATMTPEKEAAYRAALETALRSGHAVLAAGGSSLDAVTAAVKVLEDSPLFNAGKGAVFTLDGKNELDAAIMEGRTRRAGAIAGVTRIRNPVELARAVMERSPHVMLVGEGAERFAVEIGMPLVDPSYFHTDERWQQLQKAKEALAKDPQAMGIGERLFANNCAVCHGADAKGSTGFPNLTDGDWLYGGAPATVVETIAKGRSGVMPPMAAAVGNADDVRNVANYVLSLSGAPHNSAQAQLGKAKFVACAACHGTDGKGNPAVGAPNLTDKVWLHGYGEAAIAQMVTAGKTNVMPAFDKRLSASQIHVLGAYVWSLSNRTALASK